MNILFSVANGIYQNSVYGLAASLPMKYTNAVILGSVSEPLRQTWLTKKERELRIF